MGGLMLAGAQNRMLEPGFDRMPDDPAQFSAGCAGKDRYTSEQIADEVLMLLKRGKIRHPKSGGRWDAMQSYECRFCGGWHHGHP